MKLYATDCLPWLMSRKSKSVDLIVGSPPYEAARTYGIDFNLKGQAWVDWMFVRMIEMVRISRGLVVMIVDGQTRNFSWSGTPALLMADLLRAGVTLRKPFIYKRDGVPGSGGPDYWKNRYEFAIVATGGGKLPWSDNTANGHPPIYGPGGAMSHRQKDGSRKNMPYGSRNGDVLRKSRAYVPPKLANAGNIIDCGPCGGGLIGSRLSHKNEAPFPEQLVEPIIKCFCPPQGIVLDPFCGSGTTLAVAQRLGRDGIGIDIRESQIDLTRRRLHEEATRGIVNGEPRAAQSKPRRS